MKDDSSTGRKDGDSGSDSGRTGSPATRRQVARVAGVSTTTVTNVLNNHGNVSGAIKTRVLAVASQLGYEPHPAARALALKRYEKIAIICSSLMNPFFGALFHELVRELDEDGLKAISLHGDGVDLGYMSRIIQGHADGIIVLDGSLPSATVEAIQRAGIPVVAHGYEDDTAVPKVEPDFHQGVRLAVNHLVDLGHTRIGYLSPKSPQTDLRRFKEFGAAMEERGLPVDPSLVVFHPESGEDTPLVGYHATSALLERRAPFTALFAYSDILAVGAAKALREAGLEIPRDVSLVGWDDIPYAAFTNPPLTTVFTAVSETAHELKRLLSARIEGAPIADITRVATRLVLRTSTGPAAAEARAAARAPRQ
jgi:DNA-binding LacI/PurR family transcriptional regulator